MFSKFFSLKNKLSVLFICGWYPSKVLPTNGDFIQRHAEAVATCNNVSVLHIITDKTTNKITFDSFIKKNVKTHIAYLPKSKNNLRKIYYFFKAFKQFLKASPSFDVVHLNEVYPFGMLCLYLKKFKKISYIISEHWTGYHTPNKISKHQLLWSKTIVKNASFVCPVSENLKFSMEKIGLLGNYKIVPNVVDTTIFYPSKIRTNVFTITHISNMIDEHKNISKMLEVIKMLEKQIEHFHFKLIGENSDKYIEKIKSIGLNINKISIINHISQDELSNELKESDIFILFSNYENLPCVILESFSCGVPVISTNVGGISEFFPNDFGKLIQKNNQTELLNSIIEFYKKTKRTDKERMYKYVIDNFSKEVIAEKFNKLYYKSLTR